MAITDADGKPLPPEVQAEIRKAMQAQAGKQPPSSARQDQNGDIIVSGIRQRGAVSGNIPPDRVFNAADVESLGAKDVGGIIEALSHRLSGQPADGPVALLINGKRTASAAEISSYPADAIERVEVLPEAVAANYGFPGGSKLINIITFERFKQRITDTQGETRLKRGGGAIEQSLQVFSIKGDRRANILGKFRRESALRYSALDVTDFPGRDIVPEITSFTLRPSVNVSLGRSSIGADLRFGSDLSRSALSTTSDASSVYRIRNRSAGAGLRYSSRVGPFSVQGLADFDIKRENSSVEDLRNLSSQAATFKEQSTNIQLLASGPLFAWAGGRAYVSAKVLGVHERGEGRSPGAGARSELERDQVGAAINLNVPLLGGPACAGPLGCLISTFGVERRAVSRSSDLTSFSAGAVWTPSAAFNLTYNLSRQADPPAIRLLAQPRQTVPAVLVRDSALDRTASVDLIIGGNPALRPEVVHRSEVQFNARPSQRLDLVFSGGFFAQRTRRPILNVSSATGLLQEAFPDRFERNGLGGLTGIDARPVNAATSETGELQLGVSFSRSFGSGEGGQSSTITRSVPTGGIANGLPPGSIIIMAEEGSALDDLIDDRSSRFFFSLKYRHQTRYKIRFANGAELNVLRDGLPDETFGLAKDRLEGQAGIYREGLGFRLTANVEGVRSGGTSDATEASAFRTQVRPSALLNVSAFANLEQLSKRPFLTRARLTIGINNLLSQNRRLQIDEAASRELLPFFLSPKGRKLIASFRKAW